MRGFNLLFIVGILLLLAIILAWGEEIQEEGGGGREKEREVEREVEEEREIQEEGRGGREKEREKEREVEKERMVEKEREVEERKVEKEVEEVEEEEEERQQSPLEDETPPDPESSVFFLSPGQFRGKPLFVNLNKVDWEASSSNILRRSGFFPPSESAGQEEGWPAPLSAPSPSAPYSPGPSYARDNPVASFSSAGSPSSTPRPHQWYGRYRYWAGYQERPGANRTSSRPTGYQSFTRYPSKVPARAPENILARPYPTKAVPARPNPNPSREAIPAVRNPSLRPPAAVGRYPANTPTAGSPQPGRVPPGSPQGAAGSSRGPSYPLGWSMSSLVNKVPLTSPSSPPPPPPSRAAHSSSSLRVPFLPTPSTPSAPSRPYRRSPYTLVPPPSPQALSRRMFLSAEDSQTSGRDVERQRKLEGPSLLEIVKSGIAAAAAALLVNASTAYLTSGESWHSSGTGRGAGRDVRAAEASLVTEGMVEEAVRLWGAVEGIDDCRARALCRLGRLVGGSSGAPYVLMAAHRFLPRAWEDRVVQVSEGALLGSDCQQWACGRDDVLTR